MSIDWITVAAQIANFLVLVWLLKRFLYRPILDGIDAREAEIKDRMQQALDAKSQAAEVEQEYRSKVQALNTEQADMTEQVRKSAEEQRDVLLAETKEKLAREQADWHAQLDDEGRKYTAKMHQAASGALLSLTRKALTDLADETFEDRIARHLIVQINQMAPDLQAAARKASEAVFTSHGPLPPAAQKELTTELHAHFPQIDARFDTDDAQAAGLVLRIGGAQLEWTIDSYIDGLEAMVQERMAAGHHSGGQPHGS